ncbi:hypothetical protein KI387_032559 [Taxus chinensis]|uniref:Glycosyltransferase family 92 protein n=1 Tax=Taxus chinensis TaxID=29808 RepID=A0AA38C214_TAXCH|nr:hypothetical protein KI387_032559 [Taxus chinensis]
MAGSSSSSFPYRQPPQQNALASKILLLLTVLPLSLALFAFVLQWRGGLTDPVNRWSPDNGKFPGMSSTNSPSNGHSVTGSDCTDHLARSKGPGFPYYKGWTFEFAQDSHPKICVTTSTSAGLEQILPWIYYHKIIGVTNFFLFVEGKAATSNTSAVLDSIPGVKVVHRTKELEEKQAKSRIWNETWLSSFFYRPCNYELFVKQSLNMEMAIVMAREANMDWIIHLDTDELLHPAGAREYSLRQLLLDVASDVDMVVFPNYESAIERDDIKEPFSEVSMFKKNYDHVTKETYFGLYKEATRGNPNYFLTYGNGKAAARVQDHLRPNGAHRWHNYMKTPNEIKLEEAAVLHYTYTKFSDLTSRRDRCGCKPTKEDVKRCFMLEFDRSAFIIASTATEDEMHRWYRERIVWTDKELNLKLIRKGLLTRIYAPMVIVQGLREAGVFSNALASGHALLEKSMSKEQFFSSISNSSMANSSMASVAQNSGDDKHQVKLGNKTGEGKSQAASRKLREASDGSIAAVPPMAPPSLDSYTADF